MNRLLRLKWTWIVFAVIAMAAMALFAILPFWEEKGSIQQNWSQQDLKQVIESWRIKSRVPGVVVGISLPDQAEIIIPSGESNMDDGAAIKEDDQFRVASITKTFIAAEVLKLAAEGKIKLNDPLNVYLPGTPHGEVVTIRHLLSHRSGYFDPVHDDPGFIRYIAEHLEKQWTWHEMLGITFKHDLFFQPGSSYRYSNANYMLLGLVIENVSGESLGEALTSDLIIPLQLEHTVYTTPKTDTGQMSLVHGYTTHPLTGEIVDTTTIPYRTIVSASVDTMISNAADLLKWSRSLYGKESVVLAPAFQKEMLTFDTISSYGLGVFQFDTPIGTSVGHGGDIAGYLSLMEYLPEQDLSIVILVNADAASINLSELRDLILVTLFGDSAENHVEELIADLSSEDSSTRKNAIIALGHSGTENDRVISSLIEVLKSDTNAENRKEAALALGLAGKDSDQAKQALMTALQDNDEAVREAAHLALSIMK